MPKRPTERSIVAIPDGFDETLSYPVKLVGLEEKPSQFKDAKSGQNALVWHLAVRDQDGQFFIDPSTGDTYETWQWTSDTTYSNPTSGKKAKAREWTEAFMGRELSDDDINEMIDDGFAEVLANREALASFETRFTQDGGERLSVIKMRPLKRKKKAPEPEPVAAAPAPRQPRQSRLDDDEDDE